MINSNDNKYKNKMVLLCVAAASCVLLCFLVVIYKSEDKKPKKVPVMSELSNAEADEQDLALDEVEYGKKNITSEDLDFWDMNIGSYSPSVKRNTDSDETLGENNENDELNKGNTIKDPKKKEKNKDEDVSEKTMNTDSKDSDDEKEKDNSKNKLKVALEDGSFEEYEIDKDILKNEYDFEKYLSNTEKGYFYSDGNAKVGIDISKHQGIVDFQKVKDSGIDFAMIRVGSRGISTGEITLDDKFVEFATNANSVSLPIGAYFYSMATNDVEAVEEANFAVAACVNYGITYPIAIDMEIVANDSYRSKNLSNKERTTIAKTFCDTVKAFGFKPMIYARYDYLLSKLDLKELEGIDIWLCDVVTEGGSRYTQENKDVYYTDYPYWFNMWQYSHSGRVDGINSDVDLNICFKNYE